jgi:HD-GYP domain-containing protein (c-di-GMP phosphodiesterase class II)
MKANLFRFVPQPLIAVTTLATALGALGLAYAADSSTVTRSSNPLTLVLTLCLCIAIVLAFQYPVHVSKSVKIYITSIPIYLVATLLAPPLAATAAGLSMLCGELAVRSQRGTYPSDIATETGRRVIVILLASLVAHTPAGHSILRELPLLAAGGVLWAGDILTLPLTVAPITRERPVQIMAAATRSAGAAEAIQYFIGLLGALAATQQVWALALLAGPSLLIYRTFKREMDRDTIALLARTADEADLRNPYMVGHQRRVAELCDGIVRELKLQGPSAELIRTAARVFDIGKIGIPDRILLKEETWSEEEEAIMRTHAERGAELLARYPDFTPGVDIVRHHHEQWNGSGYPDGLRGEEIPLGSRIIAVADSFDAMTSERPHRRAMSAKRAAATLRQGSGEQWDPQIVDAFLRSIAGRLEGPAMHVLRVTEEETIETVRRLPSTG